MNHFPHPMGHFISAPSSCPVLSPTLSLQLVNGRQYHVSNFQIDSWKYAKEYCNQIHLELASVATQEDYDNVVSILGRSATCLKVFENLFYYFCPAADHRTKVFSDLIREPTAVC